MYIMIIAFIIVSMFLLSMIEKSESRDYASASDWSKSVSGGHARANNWAKTYEDRCRTTSEKSNKAPYSRGRYIPKNGHSKNIKSRCT